MLKAIDRIKTIKTECLVPQDMQDFRVHQQYTLMKCAHISSIVTEANHNDAVNFSIKVADVNSDATNRK